LRFQQGEDRVSDRLPYSQIIDCLVKICQSETLQVIFPNVIDEKVFFNIYPRTASPVCLPSNTEETFANQVTMT
jgi:hypothetical protein